MSGGLKDEYREVRFRYDGTKLPAAFFIVTAHNPDGTTVERETNDRADQELKSAIVQLGHDPIRVTGGNHDFSHAEPGYGISCSRDQALAFARQFRQEAIFEVRDDRVFLASALAAPEPNEEIGRWSDLSEQEQSMRRKSRFDMNLAGLVMGAVLVGWYFIVPHSAENDWVFLVTGLLLSFGGATKSFWG